MMISKDFTGGNISVVKTEGDVVYLENEIRDSATDWFYWAFAVEGAAGKTLTFRFGANRLGYFGPAVSRDLKNWRWLNEFPQDKFAYEFGKNEFTYSFSENEDKVWFAHDMLYHPDRFFGFAKEKGLEIKELCKSAKGRSIPFVTFGTGKKTVVLTSRHHACEATGDYVLEGVLDELLKNPLKDAKVFCVPFVDYDGVIDGDQGKERRPHDHNRDYEKDVPSIYSSTAAIRKYADENGCAYAFDFHSPWHLGGANDVEFIVVNSFEKADRFKAFGKIFEEEISDDSFGYFTKNDYPYMSGWNVKSANFAQYMSAKKENEIAFSLETPYFGTEDNVVSQEKLVRLGRCFARAFKRYTEKSEGKIPLNKE